MTEETTGAAVLDGDDVDETPHYDKVLSVRVSAEALKTLPSWLHPGLPATDYNRRWLDGHYLATGLLAIAYGSLPLGDVEAGEWVRQATADRVMQHGASAGLRGRLAAYAGAPLFAGRVSAEAIRRACREQAPYDEVLHDAVGAVINLLWPTQGRSRPPGRGEGVHKGLALLRHIRRLGYRDVHPGLEYLGMAAAKSDDMYPRVLRRLNHTVAEHHGRRSDHRQALYEALLYLLPAEGRPAGAGRPARV